MKVKQIGNVMPSKNRDNPNQGRVYDSIGIAPTLGCMGGGGREPMVVESKRYDGNDLEDWIWEVGGERYLIRIRKLTPLECWRLMGFSDGQHNAAENAGVSNTQRYKQAGNSIVVPVIERLIEQML